MNDLNDLLRNKAMELGLCEEFQKKWDHNWTLDEMAERMFEGIDFCLKHRFPSKEFMLNHFTVEELRCYNVYVNDKRSTNNPKNGLLSGRSDIKIRYNGNSVGNLYLIDHSFAHITAKNRSFVIVHVFDNAYVRVETEDIAKVVVIKHSTNVLVEATGNVVIKEELDYLK